LQKEDKEQDNELSINISMIKKTSQSMHMIQMDYDEWELFKSKYE